MNKIREFLRNNLGFYVGLLAFLGICVMLFFATFYPNAGTIGDFFLVLLVFGIVVGGASLHQKF
jgi:hypothetical protein